MDGYTFIANLVSSLASMAWPIAAFSCFFLVRKEIAALMPKLRIRSRDHEISFINGVIQQTKAETLELVRETAPLTSLEDLSQLSAEVLKKRVADFAEEIREWDRHRTTRRDEILHDRDRHERWIEYTQLLLKSSAADNHEWRAKYQSTALALKSELLKRIGEGHDIDTDEADAIDYGVLAGPSPITDAANLLEAMARQLNV